MTFSVRPGKVTGSLGRNGACKTSTFRRVLALASPTSGTVTVDSRPYADLSASLRHVGSLLDARESARTLSLGMLQCLGRAGAPLGDPPILVLDEPPNGLDPEGIIWFRGPSSPPAWIGCGGADRPAVESPHDRNSGHRRSPAHRQRGQVVRAGPRAAGDRRAHPGTSGPCAASSSTPAAPWRDLADAFMEPTSVFHRLAVVRGRGKFCCHWRLTVPPGCAISARCRRGRTPVPGPGVARGRRDGFADRWRPPSSGSRAPALWPPDPGRATATRSRSVWPSTRRETVTPNRWSRPAVAVAAGTRRASPRRARWTCHPSLYS